MDDSQIIRVMVVDDHPLAHAGMRHFLNTFPDLLLVGEASSGDQALALCAQTRPHVIMMDLVMPGMDGVEATRLIKQRYPQVQIIVLTSFQEGDLVERALRAGATGYLLKNISAFDLVQAIRAAHAGRTVLAQEATAALVQTMLHEAGPGFDLTEREQGVLQLLVRGLSNAQIADHLSISQATVKFHIGGIFSKMGVKSRAEVIALAYQHQLIRG
ncbi:MAG TPA: response regulator transcription factor [Roseiflexaceae bacterium]|nr:response regulator transcription factor [Roseiflexaceae bacterium]